MRNTSKVILHSQGIVCNETVYERNFVIYKCGKDLESCRCADLPGQQIARLLYSSRKFFAQKLSVFAELNCKDITYVYTTNCEYRGKQLIISCCYFVIIKSTLRFFLEFFSQNNVNKKGL